MDTLASDLGGPLAQATFGLFNSITYDVFEVILSYMDGVSLLASSCVNKHWNSLCELYVSRFGKQKYWKEKCDTDLSHRQKNLCLSGDFSDDWFAVYKAAHIQNSLGMRKLKYTDVLLAPRFSKYATCVNILGPFLVVTQGPLVYVIDVFTGSLLDTYQPKHYNIHHSYVKRKKVAEVTPYSETPLPCDILVMLCGGNSVSHVAVVSEHTLLDWDPVIIPIPTPAPAHSVFQKPFFDEEKSCGVGNHLTFHNPCWLQFLCFEIEASESEGISLTRVIDRTMCELRTSPSAGMVSGASISLNDKVTVTALKREGEISELVINVAGGDFYEELPVCMAVNTRCMSDIEQSTTGRIVHLGQDVLPVIAAVQTNDRVGKHIGLWTYKL